jgi:hypothetical protein
MSADNWRVCFNCQRKAVKANEARIAKAEKSYGKVPPSEYLQLRTEAEKEIELDATLREDYEIGAYEDGEFLVSFTGRCQNCLFEFKFKHTEPMKGPL